ncbi:hypothetical protein HID58_014410, partial [Brassica napus]
RYTRLSNASSSTLNPSARYGSPSSPTIIAIRLRAGVLLRLLGRRRRNPPRKSYPRRRFIRWLSASVPMQWLLDLILLYYIQDYLSSKRLISPKTCLGLFALSLLVAILGISAKLGVLSPLVVADRGLELLSATFIFCVLVRLVCFALILFFFLYNSIRFAPLNVAQVTLVLYITGRSSSDKSSSLKPHVSGYLVHDCDVAFALCQLWWFGIQLNPQFIGIDLKFFFVRAGMMGWLLINLSILAKCVQDGSLSQSMILYQIFCALYILDYFVHEEYMTSTWDIIAERLGFMLGWWLLHNKVELTVPGIVANCFVFLIGYMVFRGANKQKHIFKKNPKTPIWGKPPVVVGGKLLASGYWGIARHCNYLGDLMLALSFSLPCGISSPVPYFYPIYLLILLIWRERRDEERCAEKYKEIWPKYLRLVPYRILPYVY